MESRSRKVCRWMSSHVKKTVIFVRTFWVLNLVEGRLTFNFNLSVRVVFLIERCQILHGLNLINVSQNLWFVVLTDKNVQYFFDISAHMHRKCIELSGTQAVGMVLSVVFLLFRFSTIFTSSSVEITLSSLSSLGICSLSLDLIATLTFLGFFPRLFLEVPCLALFLKENQLLI